MKRWLLRILGLVAVLVVAAFLYAHFTVMRPVMSERAWAKVEGARVTFDDHGVPTIAGQRWEEVIETQGYVVASERLFQMELMKRASAGRLAEWFGAKALPADRRRRVEDWQGVAARAWETMPAVERTFIERYVDGVNRFIREREGAWGLEYELLGAKPERWEGSDSLLVLLSMAEQLSSYAMPELSGERWLQHLPPEWAELLFTKDHPWNEPMFGTKERPGPVLPRERKLPMRPIDDADRAVLDRAIAGLGSSTSPELDESAAAPDDEASAALASLNLRADGLGPIRQEGIGSNNWTWCGKTGCFVANDPHLGANVPSIWFALRLRVSKDDWVVGYSIPGLPGVIIGMNPHLGWGFTNVGDDVDDVLWEKVSDDEQRYLEKVVDGQEIWAPIERKTSTILVKDAPAEEHTALFTHRGPLQKDPIFGRWASRQWLPLKPGMLRFPASLNRAKSWEELNAAIDAFTVPAQNVVVADRAGNIGYRASGTTVLRKVSGFRPQDALDGEWLGVAPPSSRPRMWIYVVGTSSTAAAGARTSTVTPEEPRFIATANERIWVDEHGHRWADDQRKERIRRALGSRDDFTRADMEALQLDTESRYRRTIVAWIASHAKTEDPKRTVIRDRWAKWNGVAIDDPTTFGDALAMEAALVELFIARARTAFLPASMKDAPYEYYLRSAWVIATLADEQDGTALFGLDPTELADHLLALAQKRAERSPPPYFEKNRWSAQHPFASAIPVIGQLFAIDTPVQHGWRGLVRVEAPAYGASMRTVWDLRDPKNSTWNLPVGQSGHVGSSHYRDLQAGWFAGKPFPVFDRAWSWDRD
ncbi:penicillin acylase family protein [Myxococcota bacterium]|nr:penicillin acylase family protein [Myxococcota bacterium]